MHVTRFGIDFRTMHEKYVKFPIFPHTTDYRLPYDSNNMSLEPMTASPAVGDFQLLSEHEEQTPGTFFGGKAVLHLHSPGANLKILQEELESQPQLHALRYSDSGSQDGEQVVIENIDVWVTSRFAPQCKLQFCIELTRPPDL